MASSNHPTTSTSEKSSIQQSGGATQQDSERLRASFEQEAMSSQPSLMREFYDFLIEYRVWWLTPLVLVLLLLAGIVFLGGSAAAPFIYPLF